MKAGQVLSRRSLISDAIVPRDTPRREHRTSTPYGLKRVAGATGKQISALRATVAKFKNTRPRDDFRYLAPSQTNPPLLAEQSKATKGPLLPASSFRSPKEGPSTREGPFQDDGDAVIAWPAPPPDPRLKSKGYSVLVQGLYPARTTWSNMVRWHLLISPYR